MTNVEKALEYVSDGAAVGLGSGHAAERFLHALADRIEDGLNVRGVPTSRGTEALARSLDIPLVPLDQALPLDLAVDGADEVSPTLDLIKGYGHALVRERIVAAAALRFVILIGPEHVEEKVVDYLGRRGKLPIEVLPFALPLVRRRLSALGLSAEPVREGSDLFVSDNGNYILEAVIPPLEEPAGLDHAVRGIPGVVDTGLFLGMADVVLVETDGNVEVRERPHGQSPDA